MTTKTTTTTKAIRELRKKSIKLNIEFMLVWLKADRLGNARRHLEQASDMLDLLIDTKER